MQSDPRHVRGAGNVLYFFLTAPAGGSQDDLHGWVKVVFVVYLLAALWLIALTFEASTRRLGSAP